MNEMNVAYLNTNSIDDEFFSILKKDTFALLRFVTLFIYECVINTINALCFVNPVKNKRPTEDDNEFT